MQNVIKSLRGSVSVFACLCSLSAAAQTIVPQSPESRPVVPISPDLAAPPVISLQVGDILTIDGTLAYDIGNVIQQYHGDNRLSDDAVNGKAGIGLSFSSPNGRVTGSVGGNAAIRDRIDNQYRGSVSITLRF